MIYHLNRERHDLGKFSLEELRRRRAAGELNGAELVWCAGMAEWRPLEEVLRRRYPVSQAPNVKAKINPKLALAAVVAAGLLGALLVDGPAMLKLAWLNSATDDGRESAEPGDSRPGPMEAAVALAGKPVVWDASTVTAAEVNAKKRAFRVRQYVEGYRLRGEHGKPSDARNLGFIQNWIAFHYGGESDTNLPPLPELGLELAALPDGTDPIVLELAAENTSDAQRKRQWLERAFTGFAHSRHLGYPRFFATVSLAENLREGDSERIPSLDIQALLELRAALTDGGISRDDQGDIAETLVSGWGGGFFSRNAPAVFQMVREQGESFRWLALVLEGQFEIMEAEKARGGDGARPATIDNAGAASHLALAGKCLTRAWRLQPALPLAPSRMITVAMGESGLAEMRAWFDRATTAQIDFPEAWATMRQGLRSREFGSPDAILALGLAALNTGRFETDVPYQFMASLSDFETELHLPAGKHVYERDDIWPRLQAMYEGYLAQAAGTPTDRMVWRSHYAVAAFLAAKYAIARQQLQSLDWQPVAGTLTGWGRDLSLLPLEVAARTGPHAKLVAEAEASREAGHDAIAQGQYQLLAATDLDDRARRFVADRLATLDCETRLQNHEWVNFLPTDANLMGWQVERGHCIVNADGSVDVQADAGGHFLYSRARMSPDFEVRGEFEIRDAPTNSFGGGIVMGLPQFAADSWWSFRAQRGQDGGDASHFSIRWAKDEAVSPVKLYGGHHSFGFRSERGKISASINNQEVFHDVPAPAKMYPAPGEFLLGLGAESEGTNTVIRYKNVQARSL